MGPRAGRVAPQLGHVSRQTLDFFSGLTQAQSHFLSAELDGPLLRVDLKTLGPEFHVPVFVVEGTEDDFTRRKTVSPGERRRACRTGDADE